MKAITIVCAEPKPESVLVEWGIQKDGSKHHTRRNIIRSLNYPTFFVLAANKFFVKYIFFEPLWQLLVNF